jgi:hypothetical protein
MGMQRFRASPSDSFTWGNGAIGYRPGGPFDCLGPYAKVVNCPIDGTNLRRTCYATGYADTWFSVPAVCKVDGKRIVGYLGSDDKGDITFRVMNASKPLLAAYMVQPINPPPGYTPQPTEEDSGVRHTSCRKCELDIEGFAPYPAGEWRDRGNNATCPKGGCHKPI